jgi:hypothetical protein
VSQAHIDRGGSHADPANWTPIILLADRAEETVSGEGAPGP